MMHSKNSLLLVPLCYSHDDDWYCYYYAYLCLYKS